MAATYLDLLTHWPEGAPTGVQLGQLDTWRAIIPRESRLDVAYPFIAELALNGRGELTPRDPAVIPDLDWYALPRGASAPGGWRPGAGAPRENVPPLVTRQLSEIPPGEDVFVCVSSRSDSGSYLNAARLQLSDPVGWVEVRGQRIDVRRGDAPLADTSAEAAAINNVIARSVHRWSRWVAARTGAQIAPGRIRAPGGQYISLDARTSALALRGRPLRASTVRLVATADGVPWFRSEDPEDARLGMVAGDALAPITSRVDGAGTASPGTFAVEAEPGAPASPWYVMSLR